jgi:UDP-glucose-4-epimerase GalE
MDETHPQRPINAYGETKLAIERALPHIERANGIRFVALRYFNAAGADPDGLIGEDHEPEEHLIPRAIAAVKGGAPLTIFGEDYDTPDGTCIRDYVHVMDLADAHLASLKRLEAGGPSGFYNLGTGEGMSVRQVIDTVGRVAGRSVPHSVGPRRPGDPARLVAANARARTELGWSPRLADLDTIVATAWQWHQRAPQGYRGRT